MESHDAYDATAALQDARDTRDRVAARARAPRYYYPVLAVATGLLVAGAAWSLSACVVAGVTCSLVSGWLVGRYRESTGLWFSLRSSGHRSRALTAGHGVALVMLLAVALGIQLTHRPGWWGIPLGLLALVGTLVVGAVAEPVLRDEIRSGTTVPTPTR